MLTTTWYHIDHLGSPLREALTSALAFDRFDASLREALRPLLERRGVSSLAVLGAAMALGHRAGKAGKVWENVRKV